MTSTKLRLGFVGVGSMGQCAHLRNYSVLPECEVVALAELRPRQAQLVAQRYGVPRVYADHRSMLAAEQLDGIVCIQPFTIHSQLLPSVLGARVPTIIEKPLARTADLAASILDCVARTRTPLFVGYHKRSDPAVLFAQQQIARWRQSSEVGQLKYVRITMPPGDWIAGGMAHLLTTDEPYPPLTHDALAPSITLDEGKQLDTFVNYYIHQVNLLRHLLGENYRVSYADPSRVLLVAHSSSGVTGVIEMAPWQTTIAWQETALVAFERGWIKIELPAPLVTDQPGRVSVYSDPGHGVTPTLTTPTLPHVSAMRQQAMHFLKALRHQSTPLCTASEAREDLRVAQQYLEMLSDSAVVS